MTSTDHHANKPISGWGPILIFSIFPAVTYYTHNFREAYFQDALYTIIASLLAGTLIYQAMRLIFGNTLRSTAWATLAISLLLNYIHIYTIANNLMGGFRLRHRYGIAITLVLGITGLLLTHSIYRKKPSLLAGILRIAFVGLGASMPLSLLLTMSQSSGHPEIRAPRIVSEEQINQAQFCNKPDIYYLIFDRYGEAGELEKHLHYDNRPFIAFLEQKGFVTPPVAYANHYNSLHSLSSSLNMQYLTFGTEQLGAGSLPKKVLHPLLQEHHVGKVLQKLGYTYHHFGNWWEPTSQSNMADYNINYSLEHIPNLYVQQFFETTFAGAVLQILSDTAESMQVKMFPDIALCAKSDTPVFVFAHFLLPHVPYLFNADGSRIPWSLRGNTPENYIAQLEFTNSKIKELITAIENYSTREYLIILQSDEGPRVEDLGFENTLTHDEALQIHGRILNSLRLPGADIEQANMLKTPVNTFRFIFNHYFEMDIALLPDQGFTHTGNRVLNFTNITAILEAKTAPTLNGGSN